MIKKLVICSILTVSAYAQVNIKGSQIDIGGVPQAGVTEVIPGTNINCTPLVSGSCTGNVTVSSTGGSNGVQYNPSTTQYIFTGDSEIGDDQNVLGTALTPSAISCATGTCTVTVANSLSVGDWVEMRSTTLSFFSTPTAPAQIYTTGLDQFQVATATATQFTFSYSAHTGSCSASCGTVYTANNYLPYLVGSQPFFKGHGAIYSILSNPTTVAGLAANMSTLFGTFPSGTTGNPVYFFFGGFSNDILTNCTPNSTVESDIQSIFTYAHTRNWKVVAMSTTYPNSGSPCSSMATTNLYLVTQWLYAQAGSAANIATGAYWDSWIDFSNLLFPLNNSAIVPPGSALGPVGVILAASAVNNGMAHQGSDFHSPLWTYPCGTGSGGICQIVPTTNSSAFEMIDPTTGNFVFNLDTTQDEITIPRLITTFQNNNAAPRDAAFTAEDTSTSGNLAPIQTSCPSLASGADCRIDIRFQTAVQDLLSIGFHNSGSGPTNYAWFGINSGAQINLYGNGEVQLPSIEPVSGGPYCLQISTTGAITNTGAPCQVGGTLPIANGGTGATTASAALANLGGLPLSGGTMTGTLTTPRVILSTPSPQYYVDSIAGSDSNDGTSPATPFQTIAHMVSIDAVTPAVQWNFACNTTTQEQWREEIKVPRSGMIFATYGNAALAACSLPPMIDASNSIAAGAWTLEGGTTSTYQATVSIEGSFCAGSPSETWVNSYETISGAETTLKRGAGANLDATPGYYYPSSDSTCGNITLYVHPVGSTNPGTDGNTYEYTARASGITDLWNGTTNTKVVGLWSRRALSHNGPFEMGDRANLQGIKTTDGNRHSIYIGDGSMLNGFSATNRYFSSEDSYVVYYANNPAGLGVTIENGNIQSTTYDTNADGILGHDGTGGTFGQVHLSNNIIANVNRGYNLDLTSAQITVSGGSVTNSLVDLFASGAGTLNVSGPILLGVPQTGGYGIFLESSNETLNLTSATMQGGLFGNTGTTGQIANVVSTSFGAINDPIYMDGTSPVLNSSYNTFAPMTATNNTLYRLVNGTPVVTSNYNTFYNAVNSARVFQLGITNYSLATWLAAGYDANSISTTTVGGAYFAKQVTLSAGSATVVSEIALNGATDTCFATVSSGAPPTGVVYGTYISAGNTVHVISSNSADTSIVYVACFPAQN